MTKNQLIKLVKEGQWFVQGFNGLPLYLHCVASNTGWMTKADFGATYSHFFLRVHEHRAHWYYDELDMQKVGEGYYKRTHSVQDIRKLEKKHRDAYVKAQKRTGTIVPEKLKQLSFKDVVKTGENMVNELTMSVSLAHAHEGISFVSEPKLIQILETRKLNTQENRQLLSSPIEHSFLSEAQALLGKIKSSKGLAQKNLIKKFLKEFWWIDNSYVCGKSLTEADVLTKAKKLKPIRSGENIKQKKEKLIKLLRLTPEELFVVRTIEICTKWQDTRKKYIMQALGRFEPVVEELAQRINMSTEAFKYITPRELNYKNLTSKNFINVLKKRYPGCAYYTQKDAILVFPGKDYRGIDTAVSKIDYGGATELKGQIANKGLARGKVRIIRTIHDIPKVQKGEILVAYMTRPEFLPAMQKAAAFVTNEGGITSHAAIISREMKKPCIIGTKIATEILKDGDTVIVDANAGIIKIIK